MQRFQKLFSLEGVYNPGKQLQWNVSRVEHLSYEVGLNQTLQPS